MRFAVLLMLACAMPAQAQRAPRWLTPEWIVRPYSADTWAVSRSRRAVPNWAVEPDAIMIAPQGNEDAAVAIPSEEMAKVIANTLNRSGKK